MRVRAQSLVPGQGEGSFSLSKSLFCLALLLAATLMIASLGWAAGNMALTILDAELALEEWDGGHPQDFERVL